MRGDKTVVCQKRQMQTGSFETLIIGLKSGKNHLCSSMGPSGGSAAMDSVNWCKKQFYTLLWIMESLSAYGLSSWRLHLQ
jgi:hypothetical protein